MCSLPWPNQKSSEMPQPRRAMNIQLNPDQVEQFLDWGRKGTVAELQADCEPSGCGLEISFFAGFHMAEAVGLLGRLDLGDVKVEFVPVGEQ